MNFRNYSIFLCCLFYFGTIFSQEKDTLINLSYQELKDTYAAMEYKNPKIAKVYADVLLDKALKEKNILEQHTAYILKAKSERYFGDMNTALTLINTTISYAKKQQNDTLLLLALNQKGRTYHKFGKYENALTFYLQLDSLAEKTKSTDYQISSNHNIAVVKTTFEDHEGAIALFLKNERILSPLINQVAYKKRYLNTFIGLCSAYTYVNLDSAEKYLPKIKMLSLELNDKDALGYFYTMNGIIYFKQQKYDSTLQILQKADSLVSSLGNKRNLFPIYRFKGKSYFEKGAYKEAIIEFEKVKSLHKKEPFNSFKLQEVTSLLAISYENINNSEKAIENYKEAYNLSVKNDRLKQAGNNTINKEYNSKVLKNKIDTIYKESQRKENQNIVLLYVSGALLAILVISFFSYRSYKRDNKKKFRILIQKLKAQELAEASGNLQEKKKENKKEIPDNEVTKILNALEKFETKNIYLQKNINLTSVAKKLHTNTSYLSKIINTHKELTFTNYITKLRIDYALQHLKNDKVLRSYSVKAIAEELGFNSEGAFSRAFKKQTGIYPSFFIKNLTADS